MSAGNANAQLQKIQTQISGLIEESRFYEALRLIVTIANRYLAAKNIEGAITITHDGALSMFAKGEGSLGSQVAHHYLSMLEKSGAEPSESTVSHIKAIFEAYPTAEVENEETACVTFMRDAIKWVSSTKTQSKSELPVVSPLESSLQHKLANWLFKRKFFAAANHHYLRANTPAEHSMMLVQWAQCGDVSERDLFCTRAVLQSLCAGNIPAAKKIITMFQLKFKQENTFMSSPMSHFGHFIVRIAEIKNADLFIKVSEKYSICLSRDPHLRKYVSRVGELYCGVKVSKGLLQSLMSS